MKKIGCYCYGTVKYHYARTVCAYGSANYYLHQCTETLFYFIFLVWFHLSPFATCFVQLLQTRSGILGIHTVLELQSPLKQ